ncbi:MAG: DUF47 domain-containing protein [Spirochaetales bacterium]|jgi:uncharacterized protein|nr:DUF47 domain-containing protein [Spirochaetales bacterium]
MRKFGKQQKVQDRINQYNRQVLTCIDVFRDTFISCCSSFNREQLAINYELIHTAEREADDIRRDLEDMMYTEAVFPESRGDILGLVETMDKVPNQAESTVRMVLTQHITLPKNFCPQITELVNVCHKAAETMISGVENVFSNYIDATVTVGKIDLLESEADRIEEALIDEIFSGDLPDLLKILLRDLVEHISSVADRTENVADRIRLLVAKRSV